METGLCLASMVHTQCRVGLCGFEFLCLRRHQRVFAGVPGERKLRCVVRLGERRNGPDRRERGYTGRKGVRGSADGFVYVSCVGNPGDPGCVPYMICRKEDPYAV